MSLRASSTDRRLGPGGICRSRPLAPGARGRRQAAGGARGLGSGDGLCLVVGQELSKGRMGVVLLAKLLAKPVTTVLAGIVTH